MDGCGTCRCRNRIHYAIQSHRLNPKQLDYTAADQIPIQTMLEVKRAMEEIDEVSQQFSFCKLYGSPERTRQFVQNFLNSAPLSTVKTAET